MLPVYLERVTLTMMKASDNHSNWIESVVDCAVTTDSRKVSPNHLFVAVKGDTMDGHSFVEQALGSGAIAALVSETYQAPPAVLEQKLIRVPDTIEAFRALAHARRKRLATPLISIIGSAGKTTSKELLRAILSEKYSRLIATEGSENGFLGIPITLSRLSPVTELGVIEVGIDEIGAMKQHMECVEPDAILLTQIGPEHLERLKDLDTVIREECIGLEWVAAQGGRIAFNLDVPEIQDRRQRLGSANLLTYGITHVEPQGFAAKLTEGAEGHFDFTLQTSHPSYAAWNGSKWSTPLPGRHNALNLLGALALSALFELTPGQAQAGLARFKGAMGRSELQRFGNSGRALCDYYNAQPASVAAALHSLSDLDPQSAAGKWICLGDMLELGPKELEYHSELSSAVLATHPSGVLLYGTRIRALGDSLRSAGFSKVMHFESQEALGLKLAELASDGDLILIKGSRGMKLELAWKAFQSKWQSS